MYSSHDPLTRGLPHSDILGSKPARGSPRLYAACHVLHRLLVPRHPPNALLSFNISSPKRPHISSQNSNEILQLTHHAQEPSIGFLLRNPLKKPPLGTAIFLSSTQRNIPTNFYSMPVSYSCNIHGHHNRNHRIIIPLNTRIFGQL